jgi:hypothetical protein
MTAVLVIVIGCSLLTLALLFVFAPEGWEDESGYHAGRKP